VYTRLTLEERRRFERIRLRRDAARTIGVGRELRRSLPRLLSPSYYELSEDDRTLSLKAIKEVAPDAGSVSPPVRAARIGVPRPLLRKLVCSQGHPREHSEWHLAWLVYQDASRVLYRVDKGAGKRVRLAWVSLAALKRTEAVNFLAGYAQVVLGEGAVLYRKVLYQQHVGVFCGREVRQHFSC